METTGIKLIDIEQEMKSAYLDYAMSVIVSRALPDVRDGLKPVQRRVLFAMNELGMRHNTPYRKSARIVGEVLGKYHPHGDSSVYEAMVRMAQNFSLRHMLVDGQGNFGSIDNDPPAAMRYTEARLSEIAEEMLVDIDKETVNFVPNFDDSLQEPSVLPARIPNLLLNGASGIAVGMATNIPPHNLGELCDALVYLIDNPEADVAELMQFVKGPDFPTAAIIMGQDGIRSAYATGKGKLVVRAKTREVDVKGGRRQIVITELPYQVNKAALTERIAELVKNKKLVGISEIRDESDREGMRLVIELKRDAQYQRVLNNLYKSTSMQSTFFVNMVVLVDGKPRLVDLREALTCYIDFRHEVITRRSQFELNKAKSRAHILEGFLLALDNMDEVIRVIRGSETVEDARNNLMEVFTLSQIQAQAILDMPLRRLAHLERQKIADEYTEVLKSIAYLEDLLANPRKIQFLIKEDLAQLKKKYDNVRRTEITEEEMVEFQQEDLIPHETMVVTLSRNGFIKRMRSATYQQQGRGGKGVKGMVTREDDAVKQILLADTHANMMFFTSYGRVYCMKCYNIPESLSRTSKGTSLVNLIPINLEDGVTAVLAVEEFLPNQYLLMATRRGLIKKTSLDKFSSIRRNGIIAMGLRKKDMLVSAKIAGGSGEVVMVTRKGRAIRFKVENLRTASRTSGGVRGIRIDDDQLIGMDVISSQCYLLTVTKKGFGKLCAADHYPIHQRGGKGIQTHKVNNKTGEIADAKLVSKNEKELLLLSTEGKIVNIPMEKVSERSHRRTIGVKVMSFNEGESVVAITSQLTVELEQQPLI